MNREEYDKIKTVILLRGFTLLFTFFAILWSIIMNYTDPIIWLLAVPAFFLLILFSAIDRNYYLRFLNRAVFPTGVLFKDNNAPLQEDDQSFVQKVKLGQLYSGKQVVYWASHSGTYDNPFDAYGDYTNGGIARVNNQGDIFFRLEEKPGRYNVPMKKDKQKPHIHYRIIEGRGMLSEVKTVMLP